MKRKEGTGVVTMIMTLVVIAGLFLIIVRPAVVLVVEREERRECLQWQSWVKMGIRSFKPSPIMKAQCDRWGIKIDVPALSEEELADDFDVSKEVKKREVRI